MPEQPGGDITKSIFKARKQAGYDTEKDEEDYEEKKKQGWIDRIKEEMKLFKK